ncbi:glycoside hydrolase family 36 protein [Paenibacillus sp. OV219]|uniref:glycoside hydrolase family 36 protein n=1 Tax=Paenibacillus sp. OV219 TaxID=1884377 RepID=UPI0008CE5195|nr:glycoside hydrolase family 36 protein [Paenibacillus sp. OV219]SEO96958.1 alpha-galactosidase [Paenibacillus sp. OV219]
MLVEAAGLFDYRLENNAEDTSPFHTELTVEPSNEPGIELVHIRIHSDNAAVPAPIRLKWRMPIVDVQGQWHPTAIYNKGLRADWSQPFESKSTYSAPVCCLFSGDGGNRLTFAFSDVLNVIKYDAGVNEESAYFHCYIAMFDTPTTPISHYEATLRIDMRSHIPYYEALQHVSDWWSTFPENKPAKVPPAATQPMYSTWYSFHQNLSPEAVEEQCAAASKLGCETVIVDDGWQTADNARGYAYCGDWQVCAEKIPDMRAHVENIHKLGMKYILWYSVPFVGKHSEAWVRYENKLLYTIDYLDAGVLDPRYPEVRSYLIEVYEKALLDWDLDGFKLDFVDVFHQPEQENPSNAEGRDDISVAQAVDMLLSEVIARLSAIKPDIMLEFRQNYISPLMRKYGNLFRAADCPNDAVQNRMRTLDIRLLCGSTAAHADMIMWHADEPVESAALQIINVLFAVPQISVRLTTLPEQHAEMVAFWLAFWKEHRSTLLGGKLAPHHPELLYPLVTATGSNTYIAASYQENLIIALPESQPLPPQIILINGTCTSRLVIELPQQQSATATVTIKNCLGHIVTEYALSCTPGIHAIPVPPAGLAIITAN